MAVFYCIPSARPAREADAALQPWRDKGYKLAIFRDAGMEPVKADILIFGEYRGWPQATNMLCRDVLAAHKDVDFCVAGGDDMLPADLSPQQIGAECIGHFDLSTMAVMQPTGDRFGIDASGRCAAERICGSPWLGREFIESRGGKPFSEAYWHFFADEQLHDELIGTPLLWQRPDLMHHHNHWHRTGEPRPPHMTNASLMWAKDEATFKRWKAKRDAQLVSVR